MPTSPEESFKNPAQLRPEDRQRLEEECKIFAASVRDNFKQYLTEGLTYLLPFAVMFGFKGEVPVMLAIPFLKQYQIPIIVSVLTKAARDSNASAFVIAYDAYTTHSKDTTLKNLDYSTRKESICTVWKTVWGTGVGEATRYLKTPKGVEFEPSLELTQIVSAFDAVFPVASNQIH